WATADRRPAAGTVTLTVICVRVALTTRPVTAVPPFGASLLVPPPVPGVLGVPVPVPEPVDPDPGLGASTGRLDGSGRSAGPQLGRRPPGAIVMTLTAPASGQ